MMTRSEIAAIFEGIADIMQIKGDPPGKVKAYRWAARVLDTLQEDVHVLYERDELSKIQGIGTSIVEKIKEMITTGRCEYYEELKASIPASVLDLMSVQGVGPATAAKLYHELSIDSLEALRQALDDQKLSKIKGMGKKTEEKIRAGLEALIRHRQQKLMGYVFPPAYAVANHLSELEDVDVVSLAGGLRRMTETVTNAQIIAVCAQPEKVHDALAGMEWIDSVDEGWTDSGGSARLVGEVELQIRLVSPGDFGPALIYFTGSGDHVAELSRRAGELGLEAPWKGNSGVSSFAEWTKGKSETDLYAALGLQYITPELREGRGEVRAALAGNLPNLVELPDIRGDLHVHSTWSDGNENIETIAQAAREMSYEYIAICDHSISSKIANGLDIERILNKMIEVRELNEKVSGIEILMGAEVDILKDGSLDYPDDILEKLDVVIASVHSGFNMDEAAMTNRIIRTIENKFVHIIGHPTGRLLGRRDPYQININAIIDAAAEHQKSLEINAYPDRLDLKDIHVRQAKERGVILTINTDAHSIPDLSLIIYGVYTARRGWLESKDVLNTFPLEQLMEWLSDK